MWSSAWAFVNIATRNDNNDRKGKHLDTTRWTTGVDVTSSYFIRDAIILDFSPCCHSLIEWVARTVTCQSWQQTYHIYIVSLQAQRNELTSLYIDESLYRFTILYIIFSLHKFRSMSRSYVSLRDHLSTGLSSFMIHFTHAHL